MLTHADKTSVNNPFAVSIDWTIMIIQITQSLIRIKCGSLSATPVYKRPVDHTVSVLIP